MKSGNFQSAGHIQIGGPFMKSMGNSALRAAASVAIGGLFIAATLILGGQAPQITGDLGGAERYLTHVSTDKPIYRTGEKIYVRGVILRADGHSPLTSSSGSSGMANFEIKGPK